MNFVDNVVDRSAGTVRARAIVANPDYFLAPGQFGIVRIPGSPEYDAILVPDDAIVSDQARKLVLTVAPDGTVRPKEINPGPRDHGLRIVRHGLTAEDRVIIQGVTRARPGSKVTAEDGVVELQPAPAVQVGSSR
jgi:RND family efflux transporter MFP subunit